VNAYYGQWNLGVQREVPGGFVVDVAYVGKKGTKIDASRDINQPISGVKPYPLFSPIDYLEPRGSSIYHGLQTRVERRASASATVLASYSWSKLISDDNRGVTAQNSYNLKFERGLAQEDMRHRFTASVIYDLPWGRGKPFMSNASTLKEGFLGGWQLSGVAVANSGSSSTPTMSQDLSGTGRPGTWRPNLIANPIVDGGSPVTGFWNRSAFATPAAGTFGNAGVGTLTNPGYSNIDISLMKRFVFAEERNLQFRWEVFNAFNHANFLQPRNVVDSPATFGTVGFAQPSRQMQLGLKFTF
jgi:hypothetical protein